MINKPSNILLDPLGTRKRRLLSFATKIISRIFGVYILWDTDGERFKEVLIHVQNIGNPQHIYTWNNFVEKTKNE